jgi:ornithine cyclodeaminase/alanine dehydrogenase-like protein (mu-crystallin family)
VAIIGSGAQAKYQLEAVKAIFPVETVRMYDIDGARAEAFARANATRTCVATPAPSVREAVRD